MRGKRCRPEYRPHAHRIIPARAGQTSSIWRDSSASTDHPRACGANSFFLSSHVLGFGSSPRVRGKRVVRVPGRLPARIIPARAGQTARRCRAAPERPDHPRACGANGKAFHTEENLPGSSPRVRGKRRHWGGYPRFGSSPRVRGKQQFEVRGRLLDRIIPARGANQLNIQLDVWQSGSSPRVRGKLWVDVFGAFCCRIIPARAGQTHSRQPSSRRLSDHPRACGANQWAKEYQTISDGSSPRVRGKLAVEDLYVPAVRIIPARAGQTGIRAPSPTACTDHPRACGANTWSKLTVIPPSGSSPRVRGKHVHRIRIGFLVRIIPARAGQTT